MENLTHTTPTEMPSWHLEFPLRWPRIVFATSESVRFYPLAPAKPPDLIPSARTKRKSKTRRRRKARQRAE
jgi:hypothetical protein